MPCKTTWPSLVTRRSNKIARGKFSFVFFLQCMKAIGIKSVDIDTKIDSAVLEKK